MCVLVDGYTHTGILHSIKNNTLNHVTGNIRKKKGREQFLKRRINFGGLSSHQTRSNGFAILHWDGNPFFFFVGRDEPFFLLLLFFLLKNSEPISHSFGVCFVCFLIYRALCWQFCRWSGNIFFPLRNPTEIKKKKVFLLRSWLLPSFLSLTLCYFFSFICNNSSTK